MYGKWLGIFPAISSFAWLGTIVALFVLWASHGEIAYKTGSASISYISTVGAHYKTLFVVGACVTAAFFAATLLIFLFHHRQANGHLPVRTWSDAVAFLLGIASISGLVLLSVFDSIRHDAAHWIFTLIFASGAILCAIFNLIGVSVFRHAKSRKKVSYYLKMLFILSATALLVTMIVLIVSCSSNAIDSCNDRHSAAAVLEWILALLFFVFVLTWVMDFA